MISWPLALSQLKQSLIFNYVMFAIDSRIIKELVAKEPRFVTAIALVCFGVVLLIGHCMHGISQPASPAIPPEKVFQQTLRDTMKDYVLSVNIPSLFFSFFIRSHQSPPATFQPQNGSWNLKRQEVLFIKVYASFNQSPRLLLRGDERNSAEERNSAFCI